MPLFLMFLLSVTQVIAQCGTYSGVANYPRTLPCKPQWKTTDSASLNQGCSSGATSCSFLRANSASIGFYPFPSASEYMSFDYDITVQYWVGGAPTKSLDRANYETFIYNVYFTDYTASASGFTSPLAAGSFQPFFVFNNTVAVHRYQGSVVSGCPRWNITGCAIYFDGTMAFVSPADPLPYDNRIYISYTLSAINLNGPPVTSVNVVDKSVPITQYVPDFANATLYNETGNLQANNLGPYPIPGFVETGCYTDFQGGTYPVLYNTDGSFSGWGGTYDTGAKWMRSNEIQVPAGIYSGHVHLQCQLNSGYANLWFHSHPQNCEAGYCQRVWFSQNIYAAANQESYTIPLVVEFSNNQVVGFDAATSGVGQNYGCCFSFTFSPTNSTSGTLPNTVAISNWPSVQDVAIPSGVSVNNFPADQSVHWNAAQHVVVDSGSLTLNNAAVTLTSGSSVSLSGTSDFRLVGISTSDVMKVHEQQMLPVEVQNIVTVTGDVGLNGSVSGYAVYLTDGGKATALIEPYTTTPILLEHDILLHNDHSSNPLVFNVIYYCISLTLILVMGVAIYKLYRNKQNKTTTYYHAT